MLIGFEKSITDSVSRRFATVTSETLFFDNKLTLCKKVWYLEKTFKCSNIELFAEVNKHSNFSVARYTTNLNSYGCELLMQILNFTDICKARKSQYDKRLLPNTRLICDNKVCFVANSVHEKAPLGCILK